MMVVSTFLIPSKTDELKIPRLTSKNVTCFDTR